MTDRERRFVETMNEHRAKIFRTCRAYADDDDDAKDLLQECSVNIWMNMEKFRGESSISTWIFRIAVNTCLMHIRKEKKSKEIFQRQESIPDTEYADRGEPIPEEEQQLEMLHTCIHKLPETDRLICAMLLEDLSYKEIAEATGLTLNHVGVKINRIKKTLTEKMEERQYGI